MESMLDKYEGIKEKLKDFRNLAQKFDLLQSHESKIKKFLTIYDKDNWVFDQKAAEGRKGKRWEFKPIDVSVYAESMLFRLGQKVIMMSATILNKDGFCELLGINRDDAAFISMPSPFPVKNRPIFSFPIGKMSAKEIDQTLPKMAEAVSQILQQHKDEKGIIHCHTFKIANYLKRTLKNRRILVHDSTNREAILQKHIKSKKPTVLLSPSMTEGVDLAGDVSRFQVICKIPFPYLGDKLIRKKMNKWKWWYPMKTAKTIMQASGRSIRSDSDYAVTYILDANWEYFRRTNGQFFPQDFMNCLRS
jgi:Rad3-related DNA helicase